MVAAETTTGIENHKVTALPHDKLRAVLKNTIAWSNRIDLRLDFRTTRMKQTCLPERSADFFHSRSEWRPALSKDLGTIWEAAARPLFAAIIPYFSARAVLLPAQSAR
jgi:hypothetical protein